jgi:hypothetical protein
MDQAEDDVIFQLELSSPQAECPSEVKTSWANMVEKEQEAPPPTGPTQGVDSLKLLWGKYTDLKDAVDRFELLINQSFARLDSQQSAVIVQQRKDSRTIFEMRGVIQALVAEVGEDLIDARIQATQQQALLRQQEAFHKNFSCRGRGAGGWMTQTSARASYDTNDHWRRKTKTGVKR